jgi:murein DD-endopeptidase MepM/ murein hydrolase activator NlpD
MTEQEIEAIYKKMRDGIQLTNDEMIKLARESGYMAGQFKRLGVGIDEFKANVKKAADELPAQLAKTAGNTAKETARFTKSLAEANQGFTQLNPIIDAAATALSAFPVLGTLAKGAAEATKFMMGQLQNAADAFQDVAKVGGLTARGMSGLQQQFLSSGMTLKAYTKTISANSAALANFAGSVGEGADQFAQTAGTVQKEFGLGLRKLGYHFDEIGETTAAYIARQTRLGLAQGKSHEVLAAGAHRYMLELDELTRLTGASKEEIKKEQDAQMSELIYRSHMEKVKASGDAQAIAEMEKHSQNVAAITKQFPDVARAMKDGVTGFVGVTKSSIDGALSFGGDLDKLNQAAKGDSASFLNNLSEAGKKALPLAAEMGSVGVQFGIHTSQLADLAAMQIRDGKIIQKDQENTLKGPGDKLTNQTVSAQQNMQELSIQVHKLGFVFMPAAATAVNSFTGGLNKLVKMIPGMKDVGAIPSSGSTAGVPGQTGAYNASQPMSKAQKAAAHKAMVEQQAIASLPERPTAGTGNLGAGPVFGAPDTTRADRVQLTLDEMRDELKKLVKMGGIPGGGSAGGQQAAQAALAEHDHAHPHPPAADVSPELSAKIGTLVAPLEKMNQTSGFIRNDGKTMHGAIDLAGKIGDKVMAPISGVAKVLSDPKGYGNYVEVTDTITGVKHILAHLDKTMVKTGDVIKAGTQVGTIGMTGKTTGPHLHHETILPDGTRVDPSKFYAGAKRAPGGALGSLAQKYESGAAGSMAVGVDKVGGTSYGKYQIASKVGAMDDFLKMLDKTNPEAAARLRGAGPADAGTGGKFAQEWKALAKSGALGDAESQFAMEKIYKPAMGGLKDQGLKKMIEGNKGLQEMFHSTAIQHGAGGGAGILNKVFKQGMSQEDLVKAVYAERGTRFGGSTEQVRASVQGRFGREQQDVLSMLGMPGAAPTATTLATPRAPTAAPAYTAATAGLAGQGQNVISSGLSAITTALFGGGAQGAPGTADAGLGGGGSETVALLSQLVALSRDQNSNLSKILSASTA